MNKVFRISRRIINMIFYVFCTQKRHLVKIMDIEETVNDIIRNKKSISRYGDGEFDIIFNYLGYGNVELGFQKSNPELAKRLLELLKTKSLSNHIIGLPGCIGTVGVKKFRWEDARYWQNYLRRHLSHLLAIISLDKIYGDSNFTRFYLPMRNKSSVRSYVKLLKQIWDNRDLLIIEGSMTRLGVNNDLFNAAKSIKRIIAPAKNAYEKYSEIYNTAISYLKERRDADILILVSLGPTATILTYDLCKAGFQAIDTGHVDLEYEWMLKGARKKIAIENKYVNEVKDGCSPTSINDIEYNSQIVGKIV